jgi:hypothetical protein
MSSGRGMKGQESEWKPGHTVRARNVLRAFTEARHLAPGFLLSCGVLPEVSESVTERLHRVIQYLANGRFSRERHALALHTALRRATGSDVALDRVETQLAAVNAADSTAAYLFGVAVGLSIGALPDRLRL